ncbi:hypothetical protein C1H46_038550 [Malus baccata]|uniref:Uncharacterized protein n=1 Tax=Malus baccata TaxID=106549 RepID=A0A540KP40_MALBA|nr:hypothetical protein C1H46_038550 [Malus baccata]
MLLASTLPVFLVASSAKFSSILPTAATVQTFPKHGKGITNLNSTIQVQNEQLINVGKCI